MVGNQLELADVVAEAEVGGGDDVAEHLGDPLDAVGGEPYSSAGEIRRQSQYTADLSGL